MDCRVKTQRFFSTLDNASVSILDLMDCRVKTELLKMALLKPTGFNP